MEVVTFLRITQQDSYSIFMAKYWLKIFTPQLFLHKTGTKFLESQEKLPPLYRAPFECPLSASHKLAAISKIPCLPNAGWKYLNDNEPRIGARVESIKSLVDFLRCPPVFAQGRLIARRLWETCAALIRRFKDDSRNYPRMHFFRASLESAFER